MLDNLKRFCDSFLEKGLPGFDLIVYKDGQCILRHMNGYSDVENKIPVSGKERLNMYSCSKPITCTALLQLWEKGLFSLDDKLSDYMPEFAEMTVRTEDGIKKAENPILIHQLFSMTAGFSYDTESAMLKKCKEETNGRCPTRETMRYLAKEPLSFEPGTRYQYSLCHDVLAALLEVLTGQKFEDYVKEHIFEPLGMTRSTFLMSDDELDTIAPQYSFFTGSLKQISKYIWPYKLGSEYASGGAGLISTAEDYIKFCEGLRTYQLLKPETVALMSTNRLSAQQKKPNWVKENYGYGLGVRCHKEGQPYTDFGWGGAACSYLSIDTQTGVCVFFGAHLRSSPVQGIRSMIYPMIYAELFAPEEYERVHEELERLHDYHLTY